MYEVRLFAVMQSTMVKRSFDAMTGFSMEEILKSN